MTIRKNKPLPLHKPSTMRTVLLCIEHGKCYRHEIVKETKLKEGQVRAALNNLVFIGLAHRTKDAMGRSVYLLPGHGLGTVADCLKGVAWVFGPRFTSADNPQ